MPPYKTTVTETQVLRCAAEISETSSDALPSKPRYQDRGWSSKRHCPKEQVLAVRKLRKNMNPVCCKVWSTVQCSSIHSWEAFSRHSFAFVDVRGFINAFTRPQQLSLSWARESCMSIWSHSTKFNHPGFWDPWLRTFPKKPPTSEALHIL